LMKKIHIDNLVQVIHKFDMMWVSDSMKALMEFDFVLKKQKLLPMVDL